MDYNPLRKIINLAFAFCIIFSVILLVTIKEDGHIHDCKGKECLICLLVKAAKNSLETTIVFPAHAIIQFQVHENYTECHTIYYSQVSLKIRFNT